MGDMDTPEFFRIYHHFSKDLGRKPHNISKDPKEWPDEWKTTFYKSYPRFAKIDLNGDPPRADLFEAIKTRASRRDANKTSLSKKNLSLILKYSCGNTGALNPERSRRAYPSAGGRFPIEIYPIVFQPGGDIAPGVYHYNVKNHQLDTLAQRTFSDEDISKLFTYEWATHAAVGVVMTAVFWRTSNKYGERGYRYALLESGHIGQNIHLVSEALGVKCCALGGVRDERVERLLRIDGVSESVVYALALGA